MVAKILVLFNLKPGTSVDDYENWAKTVDIPTVNGLGSIEKFEVFKTTGLLFSGTIHPINILKPSIYWTWINSVKTPGLGPCKKWLRSFRRWLMI